MSVKIIVTADGSHSLFNEQLNETYHSVHGARQESMYVFIKQGLDFYIQQHNPTSINILEVGFGTGLNAWLTLEYCSAKLSVQFTTLETYPLEKAIWSRLNYATSENEITNFETLHRAVWMKDVIVNNSFTLTKRQESIQNVLLPADTYDILYFDAFAPSKQPEMWELPVLEKLVTTLKINGVFVTYCAKGQLKRDLKNLNMKVETLPGPPGKKEMVRAVKYG